jgi:hypothetical protein
MRAECTTTRNCASRSSLREASDARIRDHWIVCVESEAPHPVTVFHVEPEALEEGEKNLILWAERAQS